MSIKGEGNPAMLGCVPTGAVPITKKKSKSAKRKVTKVTIKKQIKQ